MTDHIEHVEGQLDLYDGLPREYPRDRLGRPIEDGINGWLDPEPVYDYK